MRLSSGGWLETASLIRPTKQGHFRTPYTDFALKVSEGQYESLPAHEFDAIVFHGPPLNLGLYLTSLRRMSDDLRHYSSAFLREGLQMHLEWWPTYHLVQALRTDYDRRVLMSPLALKSEDSAELNGLSIRAEEFACVQSCIAAVLAEIRAEFVAQPSDTVRDYKYTKREFCLNSVRLGGDLSVQHATDDYEHMNGQYGARVLEEIAARLFI